ncbi:hypothetical protein GCM10022198_04870 [Klugiella xanthotipulae]|uniref:Uncharacterized protein (UPF0548 family) n=1 Tax=Klugiella xanthotipulae TaxID=244735 RepID=A0A543HSE7_9MICO|nr:DUF1990 family protein [Klugiella xanthotipulae]TQM61257.1 uncharacterized protein (UPF0548 family) [Klugiella xanthotipulae]
MMTRRSTHDELPISYGAIGATREATLMKYPPVGSTPSEDAVKLGSGHERFRIASSHLMTWGAQRGAGFEVRDVRAGTGNHYRGVRFDEDGHPLVVPKRDEQLFSAEGIPYITPGIEATLAPHKSLGGDPREVRVIYVVEEPLRIGFAYGTVDENGPVGEELYLVEQREDDTVWAVFRGFHEVVQPLWKAPLRTAAIRAAQERARQQLRALRPTQAIGATAIPRSDEQ